MPKVAGINHKRAIKTLLKFGFRIAHEGKHTVLADGTRVLTIPRHNPINAYTMGGIIRDSGISIEDFKKQL